MIELRDLTFAYPDGQAVFDGLDLFLPDGSRTALLGRSGLGKSTLIGLLAGLLQPRRGEVHGLPAQGIGMVFQENRLLPELTAVQNLALVAPQHSPEALQKLLCDLALPPEAAALYPAQLSGGMARRVAIARALAFDSPLLVMDEPFKGLDAATLQTVLEAVERRLGGRTLLLVTHNPAEAEALGCKQLQLEQLLEKSS